MLCDRHTEDHPSEGSSAAEDEGVFLQLDPHPEDGEGGRRHPAGLDHQAEVSRHCWLDPKRECHHLDRNGYMLDIVFDDLY